MIKEDNRYIRAFESGHIGGYRQPAEDTTNYRYRNVILTNALKGLTSSPKPAKRNLFYTKRPKSLRLHTQRFESFTALGSFHAGNSPVRCVINWGAVYNQTRT
jgi:hypothetical protein